MGSSPSILENLHWGLDRLRPVLPRAWSPFTIPTPPLSKGYFIDRYSDDIAAPKALKAGRPMMMLYDVKGVLIT
ncbi:hypothetical protein A2U01_0055996, partial [Trifolium medium]|nr:hypothetical protein [Trifolium medium]